MELKQSEKVLLDVIEVLLIGVLFIEMIIFGVLSCVAFFNWVAVDSFYGAFIQIVPFFMFIASFILCYLHCEGN